MKIISTIALLVAVHVAAPASVLAQGGAAQTPPRVTFAASGRATTEVTVGGSSGARVSIEYGQPHARGREVFGSLVPLDSVWRAGANRATQLTTDIPLTIGGTRLPPGSYSLALYASKTEPKLIINSRTRQWGIPYNAAGELARIPMRVRTLAEPVETFTIALVPNPASSGQAAPTPGTGLLTMTWGTLQFSVEFAAQQP